LARKTNKLTAIQVAKLATPGMHGDGNGLYLRITVGKSSGKRWVLVYRRPRDGKRCELGLGGTVDVTLARARQKAAEARAMIADDVDPLAEKRAKVTVPTFAEMADRHIAAMSAAWRNEKHRAQWETTLRVHAKALADKPVNTIATSDVLEVLTPIWGTIPETASRVRGRIEAVLDSAKAHGFRSGENPAAWRGHLKLILPARPKLSRGHHAAMAIDDLPAFMNRLRARQAVAARALEFAILTGGRTDETIGARWDEIDILAKAWRIPAPRMKAKRPHVVPLSVRAVAIIEEMRPLRDGDFVFPGQRRDWVGNRTSYPRELAEHALAHVVGDKAEQAYRRDTALERRRPLMEAWAAFCAGPAEGNVLPLRKIIEGQR
jgi:integrase